MSSSGVVETHISTVCFVGDRAYKLLKPIRTSFLDFSTTERRVEAATQEIELNRRMAPDVYLGHADVVEHGVVSDRMIVMRRLPEERRLTTMVSADGDNGDVRDSVRAVARTVAAFHAAQPPIVDAEDIAGRAGLQRNWDDNFADMEPLVGDVLTRPEVERAKHLTRRFLDHREPLLAQRMADGLVRDGHGDLTAADIFCLDDGPQILDCLAFDSKLRIADVLLDAAFLVMDLDRLAGSELSSAFLRWYCEFSNEHHPSALAHHYVAYRANVRAKVEGIRYRQGDPSAAAAVRAYHHLCLSHLERAQLTVTLVGGTPGTGKSTLARGLSDTYGSMLLSTDELRKDLAGRPYLEHEVVEADEGIYTPDMSATTYDALLDRAGALLERAESVVLDASWNRAEHRQLARDLAESKGAVIVEFECVLDAATAKKRIAARLDEGIDPSDARPELVDELRTRHEPWAEAIPIDTRPSPDEVLEATIARCSVRS